MSLRTETTTDRTFESPSLLPRLTWRELPCSSLQRIVPLISTSNNLATPNDTVLFQHNPPGPNQSHLRLPFLPELANSILSRRVVCVCGKSGLLIADYGLGRD